jgi:hypothetical protein
VHAYVGHVGGMQVTWPSYAPPPIGSWTAFDPTLRLVAV